VRKLRILKNVVSWNLALDFDVIQEKRSYDIRLRRDHRGVDLISEALPFGGLWYGGPNVVSNAVDYRKDFADIMRERLAQTCPQRFSE
jgi:hypothetical protein